MLSPSRSPTRSRCCRTPPTSRKWTKALSRLQSAADKLVKKSGDSGKTDGKDDGTQSPPPKPGSALSNTGASVFGVGITAVILLAAAGAAYAFRKRRA
ncbi:MAG: hypothetical protein ACLVEF_07170 [Bifidobacterium bifidum]